MRLADFDYLLPPELIAQTPPDVRGASRLLCLDGRDGALADRSFTDLPALLEPGDLLVFNDTRVIKARLYGAKATGGRVEVLVERVLSDGEALVHLRASKSPRASWTLCPQQAAFCCCQTQSRPLLAKTFCSVTKVLTRSRCRALTALDRSQCPWVRRTTRT